MPDNGRPAGGRAVDALAASVHQAQEPQGDHWSALKFPIRQRSTARPFANAMVTCRQAPSVGPCTFAQVRGKAGLVLLRSAQHLSPGELDGAAPALMGASGALISDNTPDARTAAKQLVQLLRSSYPHSAPAPPLRLGKENSGGCSGALIAADGNPPKQRTPWESFVYASTSASAAAAVLRACNM